MLKAEFLVFSLLVLAVQASVGEDPGQSQRRIAFTRDATIWVANLDGSKMRKLMKGDDPCVSPDGRKVTFTMSPPGGNELRRFIAIAEIATGSTKTLKEMPSENCFGPVWSPDGTQILFEIFVDTHWRLGLVKADGSGFRFFNLPAEDQGWYSLCWAPDGKSIFCQDLEHISQFSGDGELLASWEITKIIPDGDMDSSKRLSVSPDGQRLLIGINMGEEESLKDSDGPPPAIWLFEILTAKAKRLTAKKSAAWDSCWLSDQEYLLVDASKNGKTNSIFRAPIAGGMPSLLIKNASNPTVSITSP